MKAKNLKCHVCINNRGEKQRERDRVYEKLTAALILMLEREREVYCARFTHTHTFSHTHTFTR